MALEFSPSELFANNETTTIFLFPKTKEYPSGVWVTFKNTPSYGEKLSIDSALFKGLSMDRAREMVNEAEGAGSATILTDTGFQKELTLATWIVDWNLPNAFGKTMVWPSSAHERLQLVRSLDWRVGEYLQAEVTKIKERHGLVIEADPDSPDADANPLGLRVIEGEPVSMP